MNKAHTYKGTRTYRVLINLLNILLAILVYWLLSFIIDDIENQPGPSFVEIQKHFLNPVLVQEQTTLQHQYDNIEQKNIIQNQQLHNLQTGINSYRDTMNQLLDLEKASIQKGIPFTQESQQNLKDITKLYLQNQQQFQKINQLLSTHHLQQQQINIQLQELNKKLSKQTIEANTNYAILNDQHHIKLAALQLIALLPLLFLAFFNYKKYQHTMYKSMLIAINAAIIIKIALVMHTHFPTQAFKYCLIIALIIITIRILINMLKMASSPKLSWLINQYKESYQRSQCPICQFSILPGVFKFTSFSKDSPEHHEINTQYLKQIAQYTCPGCGQQLFETCSHCSHTRHSLLMFCDHCGTEKNIL